MKILSSSKLSARNSNLSTSIETRLSFSYGKLLGWSQIDRYICIYLYIKLYQPKAVSSWKRHKNSAWHHKQNLNIIKTTKNWKKEQKPLELKSMKVIEIRTKQNTNEIEGSLKSIFSLLENTGLSGKTMKNRPALLQMNLKKVTYSSIFQNRWKKTLRIYLWPRSTNGNQL